MIFSVKKEVVGSLSFTTLRLFLPPLSGGITEFNHKRIINMIQYAVRIQDKPTAVCQIDLQTTSTPILVNMTVTSTVKRSFVFMLFILDYPYKENNTNVK